MTARRKRKKRKTAIIAPLGPKKNIRPAGAHKSKKRYARRRNKTIIADESAEQE